MLAMISVFGAVTLSWPVAAGAQQALPLGKLDAFAAVADSPPFRFDPFQRPGKKPHSAADENAHADTVRLLQLEPPWSTTHLQYAFAAPPGFYSPAEPQTAPLAWGGALTGVFAVYLDHSGTFTRMTTNLELDGEQRQASASGNPGAQALTMEWELGRLASSRYGWLEIAAGVYRQRLLPLAPFANTAIADPFAGHPVFGAGLESSITLPDSNLTLTFRRGNQHLDRGVRLPHMTTFELSWSW
jgi:hypothetical protein